MASYRREMSRERYEPMSEAQLEVAWMVVLLGGVRWFLWVGWP